jgi:hypothetical protein
MDRQVSAPAGRVVRIGGASGAWGDSATAVPQLLGAGVDYLAFDYLAELTMAILTAARARNPDLGYATDFVETVAAHLPAIMEKRVRLVSNAGGVNPQACAAAIRAAADRLGLAPRIAVVTGDDVAPLLPALREEGVRDMATGAPMPAKLSSANAYLGALPIAAALAAGADIVVTGRCVDSAVTLGPLIHEFGWAADDHDRLAAGSLAGHIVECGCQATGGLFTDWRDVPGWERMGYPIVEVAADGGFVVAKPAGSGGLVTPATVAEQILYEIGDPAAYVLPDVICDFRQVRLEQAGPDRVAVAGARGRPPTGSYKVCATWADGFRSRAELTIVGFEAVAKARRTAEAILARTRAMLSDAGLADYSRVNVEVLGAEEPYGAAAAEPSLREALLRLSVAHPDRRALDIFAREIAPAGLSWAPGTTGLGGRPKAQPDMRLFSFLVDKQRLSPRVEIDGHEIEVTIPAASPAGRHPEDTDPPPPPQAAAADEPSVEMPLLRIAHGRSGDKGDTANIGVVARNPEFVAVIEREVTAERVAAWLAHYVKGPVRRFALPGLGAFNFVCEQALDGGVAASLRADPWGKGFAQILLAMPVRVPARLDGLLPDPA